MLIWIFNPFDDIPNEGKSQRYWALADALTSQGHSVVWWSSSWSHRRKAKRQMPVHDPEPPRPLDTPPPNTGERESGKVGKWEGEKVETSEFDDEGLDTFRSSNLSTKALGFTLRLVPTPEYRKNISFARVWNHRCFGKQLYRDACEAIDSGDLLKPDVIVASLPPMEGPVTALRLKRRYGCKVITDIMDAWPETLLQALAKPRQVSGEEIEVRGSRLSRLGRLALWPYYRMLRRACCKSDAISAQSQTFANFARKHGAKGEVHVCYLGADAPTFPPLDMFSFPPKRCLRLLYLGAMGRSYDLDTLLRACVRLLTRGFPIELHIAGEGEQLEELKRIAENAPEGCIHFHGFLQEQALSALLKTCDIGVVPMFAESGVAVPYKVGDYLAAGLVVVNSLPGELDALLRSHRCGRFYEAKSVDSLISALSEYVNLSPQELASEKANACGLFEKSFNREKTYPDFAKWIVKVSS